MKFRKIDDKTVCCMLSASDLTDNNITIEDFIQNREKVQGFLEDIIETAKEEVGFVANGPMLSIQIMAAYPDGVMITFSEEPKDMSNAIKAGLAQIKGELDDDEWVEADLPKNMSNRDVDDLMDEMRNLQRRELEREEKEAKLLATFCFQNMEELFAFVGQVGIRGGIDSTLYKDEEQNLYYLTMEKARISKERYSSVLATAMEYGHFMAFSDIQFAKMKEHCKVMIEKKAINVLKKIEK